MLASAVVNLALLACALILAFTPLTLALRARVRLPLEGPLALALVLLLRRP